MGVESRYQRLKSLHSSIFGEILLCQDVEARKHVIMKTVDLSLALNQRSRDNEFVHENVLNEIDVLNQVEAIGGHPNIVRLHSFFEVNNGKQSFLHMIMEHCEGGDLLDTCLQPTLDPPGEVQPASTPINERTAIGYMKDVLEGLSFLHQNGIAHRDLSLENILLTGGRAVIADFGLCARQGTQKSAFRCIETVGKSYYMAPEIVNRCEYDPLQADIWSAGLAFFIMLTTSPPFEMASRADAGFRYVEKRGIKAVLNTWKLGDAVSEPLQDLLSKMIVINPEQRLNVAELLVHPVFANISRTQSLE